MSIEETLKRLREERGAKDFNPAPGGTVPQEPTEGTGTPGEHDSPGIEDDPLVKQAMEIFGAEVEGWGGVAPRPEGWKDINPGRK
jgi:hypothetical protein